MRIAWTEDELKEGFYLKNKAQNIVIKGYFNSTRLCLSYLYIIVIQVIGDKHGNYAAFPERECSIQRRNQKVIRRISFHLLKNYTRDAENARASILLM